MFKMKESTKQPTKICDLTYLNEMMFGNQEMRGEIINDFTEQTTAELKLIQHAILNEDFAAIKQYAHKMKSTVGIMGISSLIPLLNNMEVLGAEAKDIAAIKTLADNVNRICLLAMNELQ